MYIRTSLFQGLKILSFDRETIRHVSREKSLEEIFLTTLFINYLLVLVTYFLGLVSGGFYLAGREINMPVFYGILLVYPFAFNFIVYFLYGFFALMAEVINPKKHIEPLMSVGFHSAIVYSFLIFVVAFVSLFLGLAYGVFVMSVFFAWFVYTLFVSISELYRFSLPQTLIVLILPFIIIGLVFIFFSLFFPGLVTQVLLSVFA